METDRPPSRKDRRTGTIYDAAGAKGVSRDTSLKSSTEYLRNSPGIPVSSSSSSMRTRQVRARLFLHLTHIVVPESASPARMMSTVNLELPAVDACGMKTVKNPLGDITLLATDVKTRAHRLGLRRQQQVKCPVTGMVLEPNGNATRLNLDKKPQAFARSRKVYVQSAHDLVIQSVRKTNLFTAKTNEKRVPTGPAFAKNPFA